MRGDTHGINLPSKVKIINKIKWLTFINKLYYMNYSTIRLERFKMNLKNKYYEPDNDDRLLKLSEILVCKYLERKV